MVRSAWIVRVNETFPRLTSIGMCCVNLYDVVALLEDLPDDRLKRGQVGTIVEEWQPGVYEVEFADTEGITYATVALKAPQLWHPTFSKQSA